MHCFDAARQGLSFSALLLQWDAASVLVGYGCKRWPWCLAERAQLGFCCWLRRFAGKPGARALMP
jgi:hypothetical protein